MNKWDLDQISNQPGRVAVVTGANSGIGYETTLGLVKKQYQVVMACRNVQKAEIARSGILSHYPGAQIEIIKLDTSSLAEVNEFVSEFQRYYKKLDLLVNNAAIMMLPYKVTKDGFENQLATNYLGHFVLTGLLLPLLNRSPESRIVTVSSLSYKWAKIQFADLHFTKRYSRIKAYGQSKRACLIFAYELQRRLKAGDFNTLSVAAHPGVSKTQIDQVFPFFLRLLWMHFLQPAKKGALPVLYAALSEHVKGGEFIGPGGFQQIRGIPVRVDSDDDSKDKIIAKRLWRATEKITNFYYLSTEDKL